MRTQVIPMPRDAHASYEGSFERCLGYVVARSGGEAGRLAIVFDAPGEDPGPDAVVCVRLRLMAAWEARAAEVVDLWDPGRSILGAAPTADGAARSRLVSVVASALFVAASTGVDRDWRLDMPARDP